MWAWVQPEAPVREFAEEVPITELEASLCVAGSNGVATPVLNSYAVRYRKRTGPGLALVETILRLSSAISASLVTIAVLSGCSQPETDPFISDALGRCLYVNGFNDRNECKEYLGSNWTLEEMEANCQAPVPGSEPGTLELDIGCDRSDILGVCYVDAGTVDANTLYFLNGPDYDCGGLAIGCGFAGGQYEPAAACGGEDPPPAFFLPVFEPYSLVCTDPMPGEPPGDGPNGQVCTWEGIAGSTEVGRRYVDYASCDTVRTQRPYYGVDRETGTSPNDPRYNDEAWQTEWAWVNSELEANACVCCHEAAITPAGPSFWWLEQEGFWVDALTDEGLGMMAGWVDSTSFGPV